jgi:hypothetical protein
MDNGIQTALEQMQWSRGSDVTLATAIEGAVFRHETTGAEVVIVEHRRGGELVNVQLNGAEGHDVGWVSVLYQDAEGWAFVRWAQ